MLFSTRCVGLFCGHARNCKTEENLCSIGERSHLQNSTNVIVPHLGFTTKEQNRSRITKHLLARNNEFRTLPASQIYQTLFVNNNCVLGLQLDEACMVMMAGESSGGIWMPWMSYASGYALGGNIYLKKTRESYNGHME